MPKGILFWVLWVLCALAVFTGYGIAGISASWAVLLVMLFLVGWQVFGFVVQ